MSAGRSRRPPVLARGRALAVVAVSSVAVTFAPAAAQSTALAEQLFKEARDLAKAGRWAEACPKFEASLRHDPVLGTRLNLATCYERIGKLASAWGLYRESIELARKAGDERRGEFARKQAEALEPRLPRLVVAAPAQVPPGLVVKRGGTILGPGELGAALYLDPGAHEVTAEAPGFERFARTITVVEGKLETVAIPALAPRPEPAAPAQGAPVRAAPPGPAAAPAAARGHARRYAALGAGAAGLAAIGVGLVFGAKARSTYADAEELCGEALRCTSATIGDGARLVDDARASARISTALVIGGGAAVAAGAILLLTAPPRRERTAARVAPTLLDRGVGVAIAGAF